MYILCAASAGSSKLHISIPGIGVDGEREYNSSHCIGSPRVIGTTPPYPCIYLFLSIWLTLFCFHLQFSATSFLPLSLPRCSPSYLILRRPRARVIMRVMLVPHYSITIATNCIVSARFVFFRLQLLTLVSAPSESRNFDTARFR